MKNNKKLILLPVMAIILLGLVACGNLSDDDSVWNRTREVEPGGTQGGTGAGMTFNAGTFTATSAFDGFNGPMTVSVVVGADGAISNIEVTDHGESAEWYDMAVPTLTEAIINSQSTNVDIIGGATYTSEAFINAVYLALGQAGGTPAEGGGVAPDGGDGFNPGTFSATSSIDGFNGTITVSVTIDGNGEISNIEVTDHAESAEWYDMAVPTLTSAMIDAQSSNVDAIGGATYTSYAFIDAVRIALENAR